MELIDKSALVAEIERRIKVLQDHPMENHKTICHLDSLKQSLDTLEVKEVDLEEAAEMYAQKAYSHPVDINVGKADFIACAEWQIAKLMANATEVTVHIDAGKYPYIPQMELYDYDKDMPLAKEGDKYKVLLIKKE